MRINYILIGLIAIMLVVTGCSDKIIPTTNIEPQQVTKVQQSITESKECGDGVCGSKETYANCPQECAETCGDSIAQDDENWKNCRYDLRHSCGNGICEDWEHYQYCPEDCKPCIVDAMGVYEGNDECGPNSRWVT
ncbi:MAG: hypothetical protein KJ847_04335 [Firmicutes bacterium]|nr:hypothetical protein [Bacillota bacterium]